MYVLSAACCLRILEVNGIEALSDLEGQVSLFPGDCSLGICLSPTGISCSGSVLTAGSWKCFFRKLQGASVPSAPGNREVIQGGMCTSQELTPAGQQAGCGTYMDLGAGSVCSFQVCTKSWCPAGGNWEMVGCWRKQ